MSVFSRIKPLEGAQKGAQSSIAREFLAHARRLEQGEASYIASKYFTEEAYAVLVSLGRRGDRPDGLYFDDYEGLGSDRDHRILFLCMAAAMVEAGDA